MYGCRSLWGDLELPAKRLREARVPGDGRRRGGWGPREGPQHEAPLQNQDQMARRRPDLSFGSGVQPAGFLAPWGMKDHVSPLQMERNKIVSKLRPVSKLGRNHMILQKDLSASLAGWL